MVLTAEELRRQARRRAGWATALTALAGGLGAVAAASARDTYRVTTYTPRGTYRSVLSAPSAGGQAAAVGIAAGTAYTIGNIRSQLDQTIAMVNDEIIQTTTVDASDSYAGRIVLDKLPRPNRRWPQNVTVRITIGGETHEATFRVTRAR